jgi:redox-sensitive bicupin YhaK (pirin superfamily)
LPDGLGEVAVIAGEYKGTKGAYTFSPMQVYNLKLKKGANLELSFPKTDNTGMLMIEGEAKVNDETAKTIISYYSIMMAMPYK